MGRLSQAGKELANIMPVFICNRETTDMKTCRARRDHAVERLVLQ